MKRIFSLIAVLMVAYILVSDIELIAKYRKSPDIYALTEEVSFVHFLFLQVWGAHFAYLKAAISMVIIGLWAVQFVSPSRITVLRYITAVYGLIWALIGVLVITGIVGLLQYSAGMPIKIYDLSPLLLGMDMDQLLLFLLGVVFVPLALLILPRLHNRFN